MKVDISDAGGAYQIFVAEDNSTVHVRLLPNDAVGMDGDIPYTFYRYPTIPDTTPAASYGYALDGRRVGKAGAVNMKYLYDGENVVYELVVYRVSMNSRTVANAAACSLFLTSGSYD